MEIGNPQGGATPPATSAEQAPAGEPNQNPGQRDNNQGFDLANRMADLMRREREIQQRESQWKSQGDKLKKLEALESAQSIDEKLAALGLDYSKITQHYLSKSDDDRVNELSRKLEQVEGKANQAFEQLSQRQLEEMQQQGMNDIGAFLDESDEYPLVKALGEQDTIWHMVNGHYQRTGQVMTYADAAKAIENELQRKIGNLKSHKEADWFKKTLGLEEVAQANEGASENDAPSYARPTGGQPAIVHNVLNAYRGGQAPSSLGAIESGQATRSNAPKSDAEARAEAFEFLKKLKQG